MKPKQDQPGDAGQMLYGVKAIAEFLGVKARQAQYLVECDRMPTFRVGYMICANRGTLTEWLKAREAAALQTKAPQDV